MSALIDLQRQMAGAIRGDATPRSVRVVRPNHLPEGDPLSVYRNNHQISLREALAATFPTIPLLIGADAFDVLAGRFLKSRPPAQPCMAEYGAEFPYYVGTEQLVSELPYLADISALDWAVNLARVSPDAAAFDASALSSMTPDQISVLRVQPHPSMTLLFSKYPLMDICSLARSGEAESVLSLEHGVNWFLVWRKDSLKISRVPSEITPSLEKLAAGDSLSCACEGLAQESLPIFIEKYLLSGAYIQQ
jgi:hypothetical protein